MVIRTVQFLTIIVSALTLIPAGAHLAALPNKIDLPQAEYFTVQGIYRGWAALGALWALALILNMALAFLVRSQARSLGFSVAAVACFSAMIIIFYHWTFPANQATQNWTVAPANWQALRQQWEYSHAANTVIAFLAVCFVTLSTLCWKPSY